MVVRSFGGAKKTLSFKPKQKLSFWKIKRVQIIEKRLSPREVEIANHRKILEKMTPKQLQNEVFKLTQVKPEAGTFRFKGTGTRLSEATFRKLGDYQTSKALKDREGLIRTLIEARRELLRGKIN